jgi:hypothetical protein
MHNSFPANMKGKDNLEYLAVDPMDNTEMDFKKNKMRGCELDSFGSG